ncbi:hypothetical protein BAE44_0023313 [Dichanthelium oligosanthes]|uniref:Uncharacterized protein n=1 Tax=Dichanthelium oligosanthes TaxID=888268 RepID=A0A1E5US63_9POAL|nr:hypothetical protein BAE44_0023313 [Dichanthelium oligosanthes]
MAVVVRGRGAGVGRDAEARWAAGGIWGGETEPGPCGERRGKRAGPRRFGLRGRKEKGKEGADAGPWPGGRPRRKKERGRKDERRMWSGPMRDVLRELKTTGLTGVKVLWTFFERRIQPLKARAHPMFRYTGAGDPTRMSPDELTPAEVKSRVWAVIRRQEDLPEINRHAAGLAPNPAPGHTEHNPVPMSACSLLRFNLR